ncbi:hypothetical protein BHM03_00038313 [Ensete ventricosum]|nr:hypothetical protein BHM03_00038313 [Ensete ventricosum]
MLPSSASPLPLSPSSTLTIATRRQPSLPPTATSCCLRYLPLLPPHLSPLLHPAPSPFLPSLPTPSRVVAPLLLLPSALNPLPLRSPRHTIFLPTLLLPSAPSTLPPRSPRWTTFLPTLLLPSAPSPLPPKSSCWTIFLLGCYFPLPSRVDDAPISRQQPASPVAALAAAVTTSPSSTSFVVSSTVAILLLPHPFATTTAPSRAISLCNSRCPCLPPLPSPQSSPHLPHNCTVVPCRSPHRCHSSLSLHLAAAT